MGFYDRFLELCKERGVSPSAAARSIGVATANATYWKRGSIPKGETLQKLADYFGVTVDYLLGLRPLPDDLARVFLSRDVGPNIADLRKAKGLTQMELSERTGIPIQSIQALEHGTGGRFLSDDELLRLATEFGIKPEQIKGTGVTQIWMLDTMERNKKLQEDNPPVRNITFSVTPDPEWVELEKKMEDGTITPGEVQRYKALMEQSSASLRKSIPILKARLQRMMELLNDAGQQKLEDYARDLTRIPEYQREQPETAPESTPAPSEWQRVTDAPEKPTEGK